MVSIQKLCALRVSAFHNLLHRIPNATLGPSQCRKAQTLSDREVQRRGAKDAEKRPGSAAFASSSSRSFSERAFTRADLLAVIVAVALVGVWVGCNRVGERGRIARCTHNLHVLSQAMHHFAQDHHGALPPAGVEEPLTAWNMEIGPYMPGVSKAKSAKVESPGAKKQIGAAQKSTASIFACPSDPITRDHPRSYSMARHDMLPANWPPGPDNDTGVGLWWSKAAMTKLLGDAITKASAKDQSEALAQVNLSGIPDPANTLLLTEHYHKDNRQERWGQVVVRVEDQVADMEGDYTRSHQGRFNYLMIDGHVELLAPLATGSWRGDRGIWSVRKGDLLQGINLFQQKQPY
jgi:prepilin-type processing-associated H-X9-DG protein